MFDGVAISGLFEGEGTPPDIDSLRELLAGSASLSLRFGHESSSESQSSVTWTVLLESSRPSVDTFVAAQFGSFTEPNAYTFLPAGKASLSGAEKAGLSEAAKELDFPEGAAKFFQRADRVEAFLSDEGQANHAYSRFLERSPDEAQRLGLTGGWKADRQLWKEMNTRLIEESDESVLFRMSGRGVSGKGGPILAEGFVGEQNGVRLIAIFDWNSGAFVTAAVPLRFQEELYASRLLSLVLGG